VPRYLFHCFEIQQQTWAYSLEDGQMNFSIPQGHTRSLVRFWRAEEGVIGVCGWDGSMKEDQKAILGYAFIINGGAISWSAKCQEIISLSTTESEYCYGICLYNVPECYSEIASDYSKRSDS